MLLVTSANGRVGRQVIEAALNKGLKVRALDINPAAESLKDLGVDEVIVGDAAKQVVIEEAMSGINQVLYVPPQLIYPEDEMAFLAIDEAIKAQVSQFVMLSVAHPNMSTLLQHTKKLRAEEHLKYQGFLHDLNFTILQPLHYSQNVLVESMVETKKYVNFKPLHKKLGYVDGIDVAEVAAKVLSEGEHHKYATYELCGSSHLSIMEIAEMFTQLSGIEIETIYAERNELFEYFPTFAGADHDSYARAAVLGIRDTYNDYGFDANCNVLEWLLGRPSTTMEDYIRRELNRLGL